MWNGRDPILKERLFGLNGNEGNHGEDVKEQYLYVDSTPTHSYMKLVSKGSLCGLSRPPGSEEEPDAAFRFVDPILQQACGGDILLFVAKVMDFTHAGEHGPIVFTQFCEHIEGIDIVRVVKFPIQKLTPNNSPASFFGSRPSELPPQRVYRTSGRSEKRPVWNLTPTAKTAPIPKLDRESFLKENVRGVPLASAMVCVVAS